jgi:hypothetical protein
MVLEQSDNEMDYFLFNSLAEKVAIAGLLVLFSVVVAIWATRRRGKSAQQV